MLAAALAVLLIAGLGAAYADGGTLAYDGAVTWGQTVDGTATALMQLTDGEMNYPVYCMDKAVVVAEDSAYRRIGLDEVKHLKKNAANTVRAIVTNALPVVSLDALSALSGIPDITEADAVTAAQLAIWNAVTGEEHTRQSEAIEGLYTYFLELSALSASPTPIGDIEVKTDYEERADGVRATFEYRCEGKNADGTDIVPCHSFSRDLSGDYGARVEESDEGRWHVVTVSGLPKDAAFTFMASAAQQVAYDAYFYEPVNGRESSQSLVGAFVGEMAIDETVPYRFVPEQGFSLRILKIDSVTSIGLAGAVFEVSDTEDFSGVIYEIVTDADGKASIAGLAEGTYYVREKTPPAGYIPYEGVFPVEVNAFTHEQLYKNTAYAGIELYKLDEENNAVEGAEFAVYAGEEAVPEKRIAAGLLSNSAGLIPISNLVPGTYTIVETAPAPGYHENFEPATVTVGPGEIGRVEIENVKIKLGKLNLFKRDAETTEQLPGAVLGLYADADCEQEIARFTTAKTAAVSTEALMPGDYYVKELYAPEGYYLNEEVQHVTLLEGETTPVTIYDHYIPRTAGNYGLLLVIGGGSLLVCLAAAFVLRKKLFGPDA